MNTKYRRLVGLSMIFFLACLATFFILSALKENIVYFIEPTDVIKNTDIVQNNKRFRLGGFVAENSIKKDNQILYFDISDGLNHIKVMYEGQIPDLFREKQGIIAEGKIENKIFIADLIMAKHDENYIPKEIVNKLKEKGIWQGTN